MKPALRIFAFFVLFVANGLAQQLIGDLAVQRSVKFGTATAGTLSPAQITAQQDDYSPTGLASAAVLRLSTDASRTITGLVPGSAPGGRLVVIHNIGSYDLVLAAESSASTAANRFALASACTLLPGTGVLLQYDATSARWRLAGGTAAAGTITLSGDVTASGSGTLSTTVTKLNGTSLGGLATGLLKNTTSTGVPSIAVAGTDYLAPAAIGSTVQAYDADLADLADGSLSGSKVGTGIDGSNITAGTVADARIDSAIARDSEVAAAYQPLDSDLTAIAALTTTSFGRGLLDDADAAAGRTSLGLGTMAVAASADYLAKASNLSDLADAATARTNLGLGTLATQSGTISGTNTGDQTISITGDATASGSTGVLTATVTKLNGTSLGGLATGLLKNTTSTGVPSIAVAGTDYLAPAAIGVTVQAYDADLADLADGSLSGSKVGTGIDGSNITAGTVADARIDSAIARDSEVAAAYQPLDSDLTAIAALTTTVAGRALLDDADAAAQRTTLGLGTLATQSGTFSGTSSGTNTGDQTISITGDATASGSTGVLTATVTKLNGTSLGGLATGLLKNTTATGVPSIAVAGTDYLAPVAIGSTVQAYSSNLDDLADGSLSGAKVGTGISGTNITTGTVADARIDSALARDSEVAAAYQPLDADLTSWAAVVRASGFDSFTATPNSANLAALLTDETGSGGGFVRATSPTLTTPVISSIVNTGTLTLPTSTDTLVGRATTDTLTGKTISGASNTLSSIGNASLSNSAITIAGTSVSLGGSTSSLPSPGDIGYTTPAYIKALGFTNGTHSLTARSYLTIYDTADSTLQVTVTEGRVGKTAGGSATGYNSTAMGYDAMGNATSGAGPNTAYGYQALKGGSGTFTGTNNVAVGVASGLLMRSGSYNTLMGGSAGALITTGSNNVMLGYNAGVSQTSQSGSVLLGYYAGAYRTSGNEFIVNNQDRTDASGDLTKSLIYGTFNATESSQTLRFNAVVTFPYVFVAASSAPASAGATGTAGMITWDSSYIYVCVATNTWKRVAISTW